MKWVFLKKAKDQNYLLLMICSISFFVLGRTPILWQACQEASCSIYVSARRALSSVAFGLIPDSRAIVSALISSLIFSGNCPAIRGQSAVNSIIISSPDDFSVIPPRRHIS